MDSDLFNYFKNLRAAHKQLSRALESIGTNEMSIYQTLLSKEEQMNTADGLGYTDQEMEANVMRQMANGPTRIALKNAQDEFEEALNIG